MKGRVKKYIILVCIVSVLTALPFFMVIFSAAAEIISTAPEEENSGDRPIQSADISRGGDIVAVAESQMGITGGDVYRIWYTGIADGQAWCATFVSWCADRCDSLGSQIPKFAYVPDGQNWFRQKGRWKPRDHVPAPGDVIFFDWDGNGNGNHVGLVKAVTGNTVITIEGNTNTSSVSIGQVDSHTYTVGDGNILGYGVLN